MIKKVLCIFLILFYLSSSIYGDVVAPKSSEAVHTLTAKLDTENVGHQKYVDIINEVFSENMDNFIFSITTSNGFTCSINKFDVIFDNKVSGMQKVFSDENVQFIKEASLEFKNNLLEYMKKVMPSEHEFSNFRRDFQKVCVKYFSELRRKFFQIYRDTNNKNQNENNFNDDHHMNIEEMSEQFFSDFNPFGSMKIKKEQNPDLSQKDSIILNENNNIVPMENQSFSYSQQTSHILSFDGQNENIEQQEQHFGDNIQQDKDQLNDLPFNKDKVYSTFLKNVTLLIEGNCTEAQKEEEQKKEEQKKEEQKVEENMDAQKKQKANAFTIQFSSSLSRKHISTTCNASAGNVFLRKGNKPFEHFNNPNLENMMKGVLGFMQNPFENDQNDLPFFKNFNSISGIGNIDIPRNFMNDFFNNTNAQNTPISN
ncbi:parasitophorous vacuolar protein 1 [Plasmodium sp. gorilla clade G2]|uniref:parasitophorous vacuolar protein 1 n=1 Tax=Plasmodium sp. gorilla clade G2 TaxID=880535 RepID=UPI000D225EF3|nr:parasitophorous vacuolar protein 1 [Plasmodium sp. gorilla clade G2]SOV15796.1 parasitophorous vacuolar protein 1 [Plasmodium sp. gorilla clade G2]